MVLTNKLTKINIDEWSLQYFWTTTKISTLASIMFPKHCKLKQHFLHETPCAPLSVWRLNVLSQICQRVFLFLCWLALMPAEQVRKHDHNAPRSTCQTSFTQCQGPTRPLTFQTLSVMLQHPPKLHQISVSWMKRMALLLGNEWSWLLFSLFGIYVF